MDADTQTILEAIKTAQVRVHEDLLALGVLLLLIVFLCVLTTLDRRWQ